MAGGRPVRGVQRVAGGQADLFVSTPVKTAAGKRVTTIEGLVEGDKLHVVQQAFSDAEAYQCGYCTQGMIMATVALLRNKPKPTEQEIVSWMDGNLCRCCGYPRIPDAVAACRGA